MQSQNQEKPNCPINVDLLILTPNTFRNEDLLVFALDHRRLVFDHNIDHVYATEDFIDKFPSKHPLKGALLFNWTPDWLYVDLISKVVQTLIHAIKQAAVVTRPKDAKSKPRPISAGRVTIEKSFQGRNPKRLQENNCHHRNHHQNCSLIRQEQAPNKLALLSPGTSLSLNGCWSENDNNSNCPPSGRFYVDPRDGRKRPTMAFKDWRERNGLCRGCGSSQHARECCDRANRIASHYAEDEFNQYLGF